jgi:hypothetical protein
MSETRKVLRIATGAGFASDRLEPAVDLARRDELDVLVLECLGERAIGWPIPRAATMRISNAE